MTNQPTTAAELAASETAAPTEPLGFYLLMECDCGGECHVGPVVTLLEHKGLPAVPFDIASQTTFQCPDCGDKMHTGDFQDNVLDDDEV